MVRSAMQTLASLAICVAVVVVAASPAEARKRNGNGKSVGKDAKCCTVLGIYVPRLTGNPSTTQRFFRAIDFQAGGR